MNSTPSPAEISLAEQSQAVVVQVESVAHRQRRITAQIAIAHPPELIWNVLTDYEALPEFLPNLAKSQRLEHPDGGIRLEQVGMQRFLRFNFRARVVLDLEEIFPQEIRFRMVEGDFRQFEGYWQLAPVINKTPTETNLCYSVLVAPPRTLPMQPIEQRLQQDLSLNLVAIERRVYEIVS